MAIKEFFNKTLNAITGNSPSFLNILPSYGVKELTKTTTNSGVEGNITNLDDKSKTEFENIDAFPSQT
jgi:hypothetical protein